MLACFFIEFMGIDLIMYEVLMFLLERVEFSDTLNCVLKRILYY